MPIPFLLIGAGMALFGGGAAAGYVSRNAEVERYKQAVLALQKEVKRLHGVIKEQQEQINVLKEKYKAVHTLNFIRKQQYDQQMKTILMESYLQREILRLYNKGLRKEELTPGESEFITIMQSSEKDQMALEKALSYIENKYGDRIKARQMPGQEMKMEMESIENISLGEA